MSRFLWALVVWVLWAPGVSATPPGWEVHRAAGTVFAAPVGAEVTTRDLPESVNVIVVTHKDEVLILTLYRGKSAPPAKRASAAHVEEFERRMTKSGPVRIGRDTVMMLGRKRTVRTLEYGPEDARERTSIAAVRLTKTTFVAAWTVPTNVRRTLASMLLKELAFE